MMSSPKPMLAHSADELPAGREWTYEVKWDGYRAIAAKDGNRVKLVSRNQKDLTRDYPTIAAAVAALSTSSVQLDGEIVALDASGRPSFQALQHRSTKGLTLVFVAFDVLTIDGESLLKQPLDARRRRLRSVFAGAPHLLMLSEPLPGSLAQIETEIRRLGLEGVIAKRGNSLYLPGQRSPAWVKVKFSPRQEFVVGGYKPGASEFESLVVGYYDEHKKLRLRGEGARRLHRAHEGGRCSSGSSSGRRGVARSRICRTAPATAAGDKASPRKTWPNCNG